MCDFGMFPPSIKSQFFGKIATWLFKDLSESNNHIYMKRREAHNRHFLLVLYSDNGKDAEGIILEECNCFVNGHCKEQHRIINDEIVTILEEISCLPEVNLSLTRTEHFFIGGPKEPHTPLPFDHFRVRSTMGAQYLVRDISKGDRVDCRVTAMISALISIEGVPVNLCEVVIGSKKLAVMFGDGAEFPASLDHYVERQIKWFNTLSVYDINHSPKNCGTFLVRNVREHLEPFQQDCLSTFLTDEKLSFDEVSAQYENVHEVTFDRDWALLMWQRSSKSTDQLLDLLISHFDEDVFSSLPMSHSVNIVRSESSFGQTYFLRSLHQKLVDEDSSRWVQWIDRTTLEQMLTDDSKLFEKPPEEVTSGFFGISEDLRKKVFEHNSQIPGRIVLLIDGMSDLPKGYYRSFAKYLQQVYHQFPSILVWVTSRQFLCQTIMEHVPIVPSEMMGLDKEKAKELMMKLAAPDVIESVDTFLDKVKVQNAKYVSDDQTSNDFLENPVSLQLCASLMRDMEMASCCRDVDIYSYHIQKKYSVADNEMLKAFGHAAAKQYISTEPGDFIQISEADSIFSIQLKRENRVIVEYMAAWYYILSNKLPAEEVLFSDSTKRILSIIDRVAFRSFELGAAVLNGDLEAILVQSEQSDLKAMKDSFNRNLLHVVNDKNRGICEYLVDRGVSVVEKDDVLHWTPLRYADAKKAYNIMDALLKAGGDINDIVGIRSASSKELEKIFCDCHCSGNYAVCEFIVENLAHFQVTSNIIYNITYTKCSFPRPLILRILSLAKKQNFKATSCKPCTMNGYTAVHMAAEDTDGIEIMQMLLEDLGYDVNSAYFGNSAPICDVTSVDMLEYMVKMGADPFYVDEQCNKRTLFHTACMSGDLKIAKYYLEELKADPKELNKSEIPPLQYASGSGNLELVKYLYASGFNQVNQQNLLNGETPMHSACVNGHLNVVKFLLENGADINKGDNFNRRPIESIFSYDSSGVRAFLIENGATCSMRDIFHFLESANLDFIKSAISKLPEPIDWNFRNEHGETYLHYCAQYVHDKDILAFFAEKCDIELPNEDGATALHLAFHDANKEAIDVLIQRGADTLARTEAGDTMMHFAARAPNREAFKILFNYGIDINAANNLGERPIHYYTASLSNDSYKYLIHNGMDINAQDNQGRTALHKLCEECSMFAVDYVVFCLKNLQIIPNILDKRGRTALHYAIENENLDVIKMLAKYQSLNLDVADSTGETPLDIAKRKNNENIVRYFEKVLEIQNKTD